MHNTISTTTQSQPDTGPMLTPEEFGVGARITLSVMSDDYAEIILGALTSTDRTGLSLTTDAVSTWVTGDEPSIARFVTELLAAAGRSGKHVSAHVLFSRGCPGEVVCALPAGRLPGPDALPELPVTGVEALAQWSLYPLDDAGSPGRTPDHMRDIYAAIDLAKATGTFDGSEHYVTRLSGDVAQIVQTVVAGWLLVGRSVQHVTTHTVFSINSPSAR